MTRNVKQGLNKSPQQIIAGDQGPEIIYNGFTFDDVIKDTFDNDKDLQKEQ